MCSAPIYIYTYVVALMFVSLILDLVHNRNCDLGTLNIACATDKGNMREHKCILCTCSWAPSENFPRGKPSSPSSLIFRRLFLLLSFSAFPVYNLSPLPVAWPRFLIKTRTHSGKRENIRAPFVHFLRYDFQMRELEHAS